MRTLDPIVNHAIRHSAGAFKSTPVESLQILADKPPLNLCREYLSLRYHFKITGQVDNPAYNHTVPLQLRTSFLSKNISLPFAHRDQNLLEKYSLRKNYAKPHFSYRLLNITTPTWVLQNPQVNFSIATPKAITSDVAFRINYRQLCAEDYTGYQQIFTDGSKNNSGVGAAVVSGELCRSPSLPCEASIYTAESEAIRAAVAIVKETDAV